MVDGIRLKERRINQISKRKVEGKYIYFYNDSEGDKPKTQVWNIISKADNAWLGGIAWDSRWRKYIFRSTFQIYGEYYGRFVSDIVFEKTCLRDIVNFIEKLTREHYRGMKNGKPE